MEDDLSNSQVKILLVDDDERNLEALTAVLQASDYELITANSGKEALLLLLKQTFAVAILDVMMPEIDGFELARMIRSRHKTADLPIIFLTAYSTNEQDILEGYELGAVDYLIKPAMPQILRAKVAAFVRIYQHNEAEKQFLQHLAMLAEPNQHSDMTIDPLWNKSYTQVMEDYLRSERLHQPFDEQKMQELIADLLSLRISARQIIQMHVSALREIRDQVTVRQRLALEKTAQLFLLKFLTAMLDMAFHFEKILSSFSKQSG